MIKEYEISSEEFPSFKIKVVKGKVIECSDFSHPVGADYNSLKTYYESRRYKCEVKEIKHEEK